MGELLDVARIAHIITTWSDSALSAQSAGGTGTTPSINVGWWCVLKRPKSRRDLKLHPGLRSQILFGFRTTSSILTQGVIHQTVHHVVLRLRAVFFTQRQRKLWV